MCFARKRAGGLGAVMSSKQKSILKYFTPPEQKTATFVKAILGTLVKNVIDFAECQPKKHDGNKVQTKTIESWQKKYPWLRINDNESEIETERRLKCSICKNAHVDNIWAKEGTPNIQISTVIRHNSTSDHERAERTLMSRKISCDVTDELEEGASHCNSSVSEEDKVLFRTVYYTAYEELPTDKINSLLGLQQLNGVSVSYKNLSWDTITEIQECIADILKRKVISAMKDSSVYAIMIDESTDISVQKKLSICVRYVVHGESKTHFLANVKLEQGNAHSIVHTLVNKLQDLDLDLGKLVSLATDGAATMMGRKTGVGVQIKAKHSPFMTQTHCIAHRLNLACNDSIKNIKVLQVLREKFASLYFHISSSSSRTEKLKQMQIILNDPTLSIKEPYSVRWMGLRNAILAVFECYSSVLATLSALAADKNPSALGLYKYFAHYKVSLLVAFMVDVQNVLAVLSSQLQKQSLVFSELQPLMDGTLSKLGSFVENDGECLAEMKASYELKDGDVYLKGEKLSSYGTASDEQFKSLRARYINNLKENIQKRFVKEDSEIFKHFSLLLEPDCVNMAGDGESEEALFGIASFYGEEKQVKRVHGHMHINEEMRQEVEIISPLLDAEQLKQEWPVLKGMIQGTYKSLNTPQLCRKVILLHSEMIPNFSVLCHIALCISVTSVECERSFSCQNRLKSKYRPSLSPEKLDILMTIHGGPSFDLYEPDMAIRLWHAKRKRKSRLTQPYKPRAKKSCVSLDLVKV